MLNLLVVCKFLLVLIVRCVISQESPCPDILQYSTDGKANFGLVTVQSAGLGRNFTLEVKLSARIRKVSINGFKNMFQKAKFRNLNKNYSKKKPTLCLEYNTGKSQQLTVSFVIVNNPFNTTL